ncbi:competence type IV pilus minor pilin ComGD [Bacillus changyiensis]|uniref:competence type IV pilus minor pilin ComGD n=1 Tax=Bacillus changyiensis TaxID=3004103 RepID=UPI0022E49F2C|nr:competence type IV pilus minor pilin ComGD [Bacillus changyiensis]MDA1474855.1 competence type IV pilus minor pilin ComGD [Bacillus changyiensis]
MENIKAQNGFTLLESLTVLLISSIMSILLFSGLPPVYNNRVIQHFVSQLEEDLHYAQQVALTQNKKVKVKFDFDHFTYTIQSADKSEDPFLVRTYDEKVMIKRTTISQNLIYSPDGVPSRGGKIMINTGEASFVITIYLGSGKINVQKK